MKISSLMVTSVVLIFSGGLFATDYPSTPSLPGAEAYFISPKDGETVDKTFTIKFGLKGMGVAPAGVDRENTGHHHLIIDGDNLPILSKPMPLGPEVKHFGGGQTETEITLPPGEHTLQLILGDKQHIPHNPPIISDQIKILVK